MDQTKKKSKNKITSRKNSALNPCVYGFSQRAVACWITCIVAKAELDVRRVICIRVSAGIAGRDEFCIKSPARQP